jgi:alpha-tubulin suppressor-like RCC1 family protein
LASALLACGGRTLLDADAGAGAEPAGSYSPTIDSVTAVAVSPENVCALRVDGSIWCWGDNIAWELGVPPEAAGLGPDAFLCTPVQVENVTNAVAVAMGSDFGCAALSSGSVECWGYNDYGQLGVAPSVRMQGGAMLIGGVGGAVDVSAIGTVACAGTAEHQWSCWGGNPLGAAPSPTPQVLPVSGAVQVSLGGGGMCALFSDGTVQCFGFGNARLAPVSGLGAATYVAVGNDHACAVTTDGHVVCWGANQSGQLGVSDVTATGPVTVPDLQEAVEVCASGGPSYSCALLASGQVACWGNNYSGALGTQDLRVLAPGCNNGPKAPTNTCSAPVMVPGIDNAIHIAGAADQVCVVRADGTVTCWGEGVGKCGSSVAGP